MASGQHKGERKQRNQKLEYSGLVVCLKLTTHHHFLN